MFLITEPVQGDTVDYFEVEIDGSVVRSDAQVDGDLKRLHHDLDEISMGNHSVRVAAVNGWGTGGFTDPFEFVAALPDIPSGVGLSVN